MASDASYPQSSRGVTLAENRLGLYRSRKLNFDDKTFRLSVMRLRTPAMQSCDLLPRIEVLCYIEHCSMLMMPQMNGTCRADVPYSGCSERSVPIATKLLTIAVRPYSSCRVRYFTFLDREGS